MITRQLGIQNYTVDHCPLCSETHTFKVVVEVAESKIPLFGGGGDESLTKFRCPNTNQLFAESVPALPNGQIIGAILELNQPQQVFETTSPALMDTEIEEWTKKSRSIPLDFCKTMISLSIGAIPVYFAVLKFLGFQTISGMQFVQVVVLPPLFYLAALIAYVLTLRPTFRRISKEDFSKFRESRLSQLNCGIKVATLFFIAATALAIAIFSYLIIQSTSMI